MGEDTGISWTDSTWNPYTGCSKVSEGCRFCYAESLSLRMGWSKREWAAPYAAENVVFHPDRLTLPLRWQSPRSIFVNSMSDLFHEVIPYAHIDRIFAVMALASRHRFQILTKRPQIMRDYLSDPYVQERILQAAEREFGSWIGRGHVQHLYGKPRVIPAWPLPNVWCGTSVEDQRAADLRLPELVRTPAAVRFLSAEPLLGPIDLRSWLTILNWLNPFHGDADVSHPIHWVIVGGESGHHMSKPEHADRWMAVAWARALRDQCVESETAYFYKQASGTRSGHDPWLVEEDGTRWQWHQMPGALTAPELIHAEG